MKKITLLLFVFMCFTLSAQQLINNKGNRNQSYPHITETKPQIVQLINQVNQDSLEARIRYMQGFFRGATTPAALTVQNWLIDHFESYGYDDISVHYFTMEMDTLDAGNVVVIKKGTEFPDEYIMITSHYDHSSWGYLCGPGADDNASGTSGVMECARLLKDFPTKRSIMFVPFNAEEYWMVGSFPFAQKCAAENLNIIAHFNMDMIGWFPPGNPNTIMASGYSYISKSLFEYYSQTANTYIPSIPTIRLSEDDSYGGDHMSLNIFEYPSIYIGDIEYHNIHPCYHQMCDTIGPYQVGVNCGVNRLDLAKAFVQSTLSAAAELANAWLPPQNLSACSGIDKITISWDTNNESVSYKIFKNDTFLDETVENYSVDNNVELNKKYEYYTIAVNQSGQETAPSNKDEITFVEPLELPYSNDFSVNKYGFEQNDWVLRNMGSTGSLCNTSGSGSLPDNYLSVAESDWFPIPKNTENIAVRFKWAGNLRGIWHDNGIYHNTNLFFEVTNDRKTWHKLACISGEHPNWKNYEFSLNPFINSDFFQVRFRLESSGAQGIYTKIGYITDFEIDFVLGNDTVVDILDHYAKMFTFTPNPANMEIHFLTDLQEPYHIAIYDINGKKVFSKDAFRDNSLNVSDLRSGIYFVVASTKQHRIARKLVIN